MLKTSPGKCSINRRELGSLEGYFRGNRKVLGKKGFIPPRGRAGGSQRPETGRSQIQTCQGGMYRTEEKPLPADAGNGLGEKIEGQEEIRIALFMDNPRFKRESGG